MSSIPATHVIQVTNVAPAATIDQMKELFGYLGRIRDIKLYPTSESYILDPQSRVCYVEYYEKWSVGVAQHLTNTVFIDRALIVVPIADDGIPSESTALALTNPSSALPGLVSSGPNALINEISGVDGSLVITTIDPKLTALGLPQYPPLPANLDPVKIEEIRRTVTVGNLSPTVTAENLLKFVNQIGEVKFLRMSGDGIQVTKYALVEFTDQSSIPKVLQYNGVAFEGRPLIINHSTCAIIKPLPKSSETAQKEIDEAMKRVREAQSLIAAVVEPELPEKERRRSRRSRSRSRSRYRSSSRSRRRRSRSRSKRSRSRRRSSHSRRRSRTPPKHSKHKSRSKSRERKKDASPRRKKDRSRSHSRGRKKDASPHHKKVRSRSRSRDRRKEVSSPRRKKERSRSHSRDRKKVSSPRHKKERSRSPSRDRYKRHRSNSLSPSKSSSKSKSRKSKRSKEKVERSKERERTPKLEKNDKKDKSDERRSGSHHREEKRSESQHNKENNQSNELYGPSLPIPELISSFLEDSKSREQKFNSDMSLSPSSINTASVETSQNINNDSTFNTDMFGKNLSIFDISEEKRENKLDHDNIPDATTNTSQQTLTRDNTEVLLNEGNDSISNMYCNKADNCETMDSFHQQNSNADYEEIKVYGASGHQSIISDNENTQNKDISANLISKEELNNNFNKNNTCDSLSALASSSTQSLSENPLGNSAISTFDLPCNNVEKDSANNSREPSNSIKSSVRCDKQQPSRSLSRSPSVVKRKKHKRSRSRSLSKENSYSRKYKSRSGSKIRSRSRSYRRSRSRSKGSRRKTRSPSRYHKIRNRSRSRSNSTKRKSYSPRRQYDSRRKNSSPKHHSSSSRKRSITPRRKSRTPRRRSPTPHQKSRSPKHRSRSRSYKSHSPRNSKSRKYVRSRRTTSKSPKRRSSSPSSSNLRLEQRKVVKENNKDKESKSNSNFVIDGANIDSKVALNYDEEDYNLEKMIEQKGHDNLVHLPINVENNYNCDYNSADMDLGSD